MDKDNERIMSTFSIDKCLYTIKEGLKRGFLLAFTFGFYTTTFTQVHIKADLLDIIQSAQSGSSAYLLAKTKLENQYWRQVSFDAIFKPQFSINATLPSLNRTISAIALPDGTEAFVNRSFMRNSVGLQINQVVEKTGGNFFLSSSLDRLDLFGTGKSTSYLTSPISFGFNQPLNQFNELQWRKDLIGMEYKMAEKTYVEEREMIALETTNRFFDLYLTELDLDNALENQEYLDTLAIKTKGRFKLGRISETEMLQVELSAQNANASVSRLKQAHQSRTERLRDYLGIKEATEFELFNPGEIPVYYIDENLALSQAEANRSVILSYEIRLKEALMEVERAKKSNAPELNLSGRFGLTQSFNQFGDIFKSLQDEESLQLGIRIPIADWGRSKAQKEIAKSSYELSKIQVAEDRINFEREVLLTVRDNALIRDQLELASSALVIATKRQAIAKSRYTLGKLDATNLNIAIQEYGTARTSYYQTLWDLWQVHYQLRFLTLYDFQNEEMIGG